MIVRLVATIWFFGIVEGCAPRYVPVHHYHEVERIKVERDSIYNSDTVRIAERGDTVLMEVVKWRTRYKTATDTLIRVDTVQLPPQLLAQPAPERQPWWHTLLIAIVFLGVAVIVSYILI